MNWLAENWEKTTFRMMGVVVFGFSALRLWQGDTTGFAALFGLAFFCFFYANLSRFKKFKGLGFEAELWEDKQKEAEALIERLRAIVGIYSRELLISKAMIGRWDSASRWREQWKLYEDVAKQHELLGGKFELESAKERLWALFMFDLLCPNYNKLRLQLSETRERISQKIQAEFSPTIQDSRKYGERLQQQNAIVWELDDLFELALKKELGAEILRWYETASAAAADAFEVDTPHPSDILEEVRKLSKTETDKAMRPTEQLIAMSERKREF